VQLLHKVLMRHRANGPACPNFPHLPGLFVERVFD